MPNPTKHFADNWDVFIRLERLALIRMLPAYIGDAQTGYLQVPPDLEHKQWVAIESSVQGELMKLDWEFAIGRRLPGFSND